ncbi:MAG: GNAT family protein [Rhodospirillaceae bacterium]
MSDHTTNDFGQPVGNPSAGWTARPRPDGRPLAGRTAQLEKLSGGHADDLYAAMAEDDGRMWTYMAYGPFADQAAFRDWVETSAKSTDPFYYAIISQQSGKALGWASLMRITPEHGVIEVGSIAYAPALRKTVMATEAMTLMMAHAFDDLGYRRYEWKCDSLNAPSRAAAHRLGFIFEGIFPQHIIYKGRNRDTAWFSITDRDWPAVKAAHQAWLQPENFDADGEQIKPLSALTQSCARR